MQKTVFRETFWDLPVTFRDSVFLKSTKNRKRLPGDLPEKPSSYLLGLDGLDSFLLFQFLGWKSVSFHTFWGVRTPTDFPETLISLRENMALKFRCDGNAAAPRRERQLGPSGRPTQQEPFARALGKNMEKTRKNMFLFF